MNNDIVTIDATQLSQTVQGLPGVVQWIQGNHDRGLQKGQSLLDTLQAEGMTPEIDAECARYLELAKKCRKIMNEKRSPMTKIMDEYRKQFTSLENDFDVNSTDTIPGKIQAYRNQYAAEKLKAQREEEQKAQANAMRNQRIEAYKAAVKAEFMQNATACFNNRVLAIKTMFNDITLQNIEFMQHRIEQMSDEFTLYNLCGNLVDPSKSKASVEGLPADVDTKAIRHDLYISLHAELSKTYKQQFNNERQNLLNLIPNKRNQLELALTNADAAKAEEEALKARMAEDAAKSEEEAKKKAEEAKMEEERQKAMQAFGMLEGTVQPSVKADVKYVCELTEPKGIGNLFNFWWVNEGQKMSVEELQKKFKFLFTYAEKRANDKTHEMVSGGGVIYRETVKAK